MEEYDIFHRKSGKFVGTQLGKDEARARERIVLTNKARHDCEDCM